MATIGLRRTTVPQTPCGSSTYEVIVMKLHRASRRSIAPLTLIALALSAGALACTSSSGGDPADPNTPPGQQPDDKKDDNDDATGSCGADVDLVFPLRQFGDNDLIRGIRVDGDDIYFADSNDIYKVPAAGGSPVVVAKASIDFWVTKDAILVLDGASKDAVLRSTPKAGGDAKVVVEPLPLADPHDSSSPDTGIVDSTHLYWVSRDSKFVFNQAPAFTYSIHRAPLAGGAVETLFTSSDHVKGLHEAGGKILFLQDGDKDVAMEVPVAGGTATPVKIDKAGAVVIAANDTSLFYATSDFADVEHSGVYRAPIAGGAAEQLYQGTITTAEAALAGDKIVFDGIVTINKTATTSGDIVKGIYGGSAATGAAKMVGCFDSTYTVHAIGATPSTALVSIYKSKDNVAGIARIKL
jgi:hypothetical protein